MKAQQLVRLPVLDSLLAVLVYERPASVGTVTDLKLMLLRPNAAIFRQLVLTWWTPPESRAEHPCNSMEAFEVPCLRGQ